MNDTIQIFWNVIVNECMNNDDVIMMQDGVGFTEVRLACALFTLEIMDFFW